MRADGIVKLKKELIDGARILLKRITVLQPNRGELARDKGEKRAPAVFPTVVKLGDSQEIVPALNPPASGKLILERRIEPAPAHE